MSARAYSGTAVRPVRVALAGVPGEAADAAVHVGVDELQVLAVGAGVAGRLDRVEQRRPVVGVQRRGGDLHVAHDRPARAVDGLGDVPDVPLAAGLLRALVEDRVGHSRRGCGRFPGTACSGWSSRGCTGPRPAGRWCRHPRRPPGAWAGAAATASAGTLDLTDRPAGPPESRPMRAHDRAGALHLQQVGAAGSGGAALQPVVDEPFGGVVGGDGGQVGAPVRPVAGERGPGGGRTDESERGDDRDGDASGTAAGESSPGGTGSGHGRVSLHEGWRARCDRRCGRVGGAKHRRKTFSNCPRTNRRMSIM